MRGMNPVLFLTPIISIFLAGCTSLNKTNLSTEDLHSTLQRLAARHHVCGVAIAVIKDRKLDSIDTATGCLPALTVNSDSVFQAASLSKTVFAYEVLKLVEQGKLELDAPIMKYLPQGYRHQFNPFATKPPFKTDIVTDSRIQEVTVRMALNHTSGLPNWASGSLGFDSTPGAKWQYSGEGFVLLQRAVEEVTGKPLDKLMIEQVFKPQAMSHSDYIWSSQLEQNMLPGNKANGAPRARWDFTTPIAPVTLYTSAADYGNFLVTLLNDGYLLKQITETPVTVDPSLNLSWGLGWGIERTKEDLFIWHWGSNPGYRAFVIASVRTGNGFVMLTNSENGLKLAKPITQKVLPGEHKIFKFPMLDDGITDLLCQNLGLCF